MANTSIGLLFAAILLPLVCYQTQAFNDATHYDPEHQDGIPIISSRGLPQLSSWNDDGPSVLPQRRSSDADLEDGLEDDEEDDRDEYKSGSTNHDSYENPAFGESRRAARDGEDIESFFDKHIGPQDDTDAPSEEREVPIETQSRVDPDDHYEAAASSPLSSVIQSILNHAHKQKLIIHTEDTSDSETPSKQTSNSPSPMASSLHDSPYVEAAPIAYYTPVATESHESGDVRSQYGQEDYGPVKEIYISGRPMIASNYQPQPMSVQSSNANWRGFYPSGTHQGQTEYGPAMPMAASYAYNNREQPVQNDEEQTVSFGLSFGSAPTETSEENSGGDNQDQGQNSVDEPTYNQQPMRHSSSRYYNNYNYAPMAIPQGHVRGNGYAPGSHYLGSRYHRDPSETMARGVGYNQYRPRAYGPQNVYGKDESSPTRQRLMANLNRELKNSKYYRQGASTIPQSYIVLNRDNVDQRQQATRLDVLDSRKFARYQPVLFPYASSTSYSGHVVACDEAQVSNETCGATFESGRSNSVNRTLENPSANNNITNSTHKITSGPVVHLQSNDTAVSNFETTHHRVRRDDSDDRESEDPDDDGVWVDDDEDDDNKQQSSDLNETSQEPEDETEGQQDDVAPANQGYVNPPGVIGRPHSYELSPNDLMIYNGK